VAQAERTVFLLHVVAESIPSRAMSPPRGMFASLTGGLTLTLAAIPELQEIGYTQFDKSSVCGLDRHAEQARRSCPAKMLPAPLELLPTVEPTAEPRRLKQNCKLCSGDCPREEFSKEIIADNDLVEEQSWKTLITEIRSLQDAPTVEDIQKLSRGSRFARIIRDVVPRGWCQRFLELSERRGLTSEGTLTNRIPKDAEPEAELEDDRSVLLDALYQRVQDAVPQHMRAGHAVGLNERMQIQKHSPGSRFEPRIDSAVIRSEGDRAGEMSQVTFLLHLNDEFEGGDTVFFPSGDPSGERIVVKPQTGSVLIFLHPMLHEMSLLEAGHKYDLRTDVMYSDRDDGDIWEH